MSRTTTTNKVTGETFPRKSKGKNGKGKKFFGHRYGDGTNPQSKKGKDFINDGYPCELRNRSVIKRKIQEEIAKEEIEAGYQNMKMLSDFDEAEDLF